MQQKKQLSESLEHIDRLNSIKNLFGPLMKVENIEKLINGRGYGMITSISYKIGSEIVLNQLTDIQTNANVLTDTMRDKKDYDSEIKDHLQKIKSTGNIQKDTAVAYMLQDIKTSKNKQDLDFSNNLSDKISQPIRKILNNIRQLKETLSDQKEQEQWEKLEEKIDDLDENALETIKQKTVKYAMHIENMLKEIDSSSESIKKIDETVQDNIRQISFESRFLGLWLQR